MKLIRTGLVSLLVFTVVVALAVAYAKRQPSVEAGAAEAPRAGNAVPAAALPSPTLPLPPLPNVPAPTPRLTDPDLSRARPPQGISAIRPSLPTTGPGEPAFTEADVRAFVAANGVDYGKMRSTAPYEIESVVFLPSAEAKRRLNVISGLPDTTLLCLVTIRGTFADVGGPPPNPQTGAPSGGTFGTMILIFDARNGNLIGREGFP